MTAGRGYADWIAVDWGTTNLRAWAMKDGAPIAHGQSNKGMGTLEPEGFELALLDLIETWLGADRTLVIACGMVGSRSGWVEAPYARVPSAPLSATMARAPVTDPRLDVRVISGLSQDAPADVMRGEETQIAGYLHQNLAFDGVLCLPGTHSKWVQVSAGEVVSFRTFMTGEMFSLLSDHSVLRLTVGKGWDDRAFLDAVTDAMGRPEAIAQRLFTLRAEGLLHGLAGDAARSRLSGLLIGAELAAARPYWLGQEVVLIGDDTLAAAYAAALVAQGLTPGVADATDLTLAGLSAARAFTSETTS